MSVIYPIAVFILAGLCEIGGGYLIWLWLREEQSMLFGLGGGILLILYGVVATMQVYPTFGRVYAAYGGVFIVMSLIWGFVVDKEVPDKFDVIGAVVCIVGVLIMVLPHRG
nr:YnfA family protein [Staphylococcus massiliensis]